MKKLDPDDEPRRLSMTLLANWDLNVIIFLMMMTMAMMRMFLMMMMMMTMMTTFYHKRGDDIGGKLRHSGD